MFDSLLLFLLLCYELEMSGYNDIWGFEFIGEVEIVNTWMPIKLLHG